MVVQSIAVLYNEFTYKKKKKEVREENHKDNAEDYKKKTTQKEGV